MKFQQLFARGGLKPSLLYTQSLKALRPGKEAPYQLYEKMPERFYHTALHLLFSHMGIRVHSEVCTSEGRADAVVETASTVYVLEFKLDQSAEVALEQIRKKRYYQAFSSLGKPVIGLGVSFSGVSKNIEDWKAEEMV